MRILSNGTVEIRNKTTGETKVIKPEELGNYGISYDTYRKEAEAFQQIPGTPKVINNEPSEAEKKRTTSKSDADRVISQLEKLYFQDKGSSSDDLSKGRLGGVLSTITSALGFNQPASTYKDARRSSGAQLARALGDVGNLNEGEQKAAIGLLPTLFSTPEEAAAGFNALREKLGVTAGNNVSPTGTQRLLDKGTDLQSNPIVQNLLKFGQNAQQDTNQIVQGAQQLPGQVAQAAQEDPLLGVTKLLGQLGINTAKGYGELITNPVETVTNKPVSTFFNLLPAAQGIRSINTAGLPSKPNAPVEAISTIADAEGAVAKPGIIQKITSNVKTKAAEDLLKSGSGAMNKAFDAGVDPRKVIVDSKLSGSYDDLLGPIEERGYSGKVGKKITDAESRIQKTLEKSNESLDWNPVIEELTKMKEKLSKGNLKGNSEKVAALDEEIRYYQEQPPIASKDALDVVRAANETFGNSIVNETKGAVSTQVNKVIANTLRDTLKKKYPEIAEALSTQQGLIITREILKDARGGSAKGGLSGSTKFNITQPLKLLEPILRNPKVSSYLSSGGRT